MYSIITITIEIVGLIFSASAWFLWMCSYVFVFIVVVIEIHSDGVLFFSSLFFFASLVSGVLVVVLNCFIVQKKKKIKRGKPSQLRTYETSSLTNSPYGAHKRDSLSKLQNAIAPSRKNWNKYLPQSVLSEKPFCFWWFQLCGKKSGWKWQHLIDRIDMHEALSSSSCLFCIRLTESISRQNFATIFDEVNRS